MTASSCRHHGSEARSYGLLRYRCSNERPGYLSFGNLVTVRILLALLRIFASLASRFDVSFLRKSSLCEEGLLASSCLIIAFEFLIDLTSLVSSIARPRQVKRPAVDVGSIWCEVSIIPPSLTTMKPDNTQVGESSSSPKWVKYDRSRKQVWVRGALKPGLPGLQHRRYRTLFRSSAPGLKYGTYLPEISTGSPVRGFFPLRGW